MLLRKQFNVTFFELHELLSQYIRGIIFSSYCSDTTPGKLQQLFIADEYAYPCYVASFPAMCSDYTTAICGNIFHLIDIFSLRHFSQPILLEQSIVKRPTGSYTEVCPISVPWLTSSRNAFIHSKIFPCIFEKGHISRPTDKVDVVFQLFDRSLSDMKIFRGLKMPRWRKCKGSNVKSWLTLGQLIFWPSSDIWSLACRRDRDIWWRMDFYLPFSPIAASLSSTLLVMLSLNRFIVCLNYRKGYLKILLSLACGM